MDLKDFGKSLAQYAPLLAQVLPIPGGAAISQLIAHEFGGDSSNLSDLASRILNDPSAQIKLAELQATTKVQLQQLLFQNAQAEALANNQQLESDRQDRADARKNGINSYMPCIVTLIVSLGFFACFATLFLFGNSNTDIQILYMMVGNLSTAFGGAVTFWLGSSVSSRSKDAALQKTLANLSQS